MYAGNCTDEASSKAPGGMHPANQIGMTPGHAVNMAPGHAVNMAPGHAVNMAPGHAVNMAPGHAVNMAPGHPMNITPGHPVNMAPGHAVNMAPGHAVNMAPGHPMNMTPVHATNMMPGHAMHVGPPGGPSLPPHSGMSMLPMSMASSNTLSMTLGSAMGPVQNGGAGVASHSGMGVVPNNGVNPALHMSSNVNMNMMPSHAVNMQPGPAMNMVPNNTVNMMHNNMVPNNAMNMGSNNTVSMVPGNNVSMVPGNNVNMVPNNAMNMVPNNPVNMVPNNPVNVVSNNTMNMVPNNGVNMVPNNGVNMVPNNGVNMVPNNGMNMVPNNGMNMMPTNGMNMVPNNTMSMMPNNTMNMMPNNSLNMMPNSAMNMVPNNAMYVGLNNVVGMMTNNGANTGGNHMMHRPMKKCMNMQQYNVMNVTSNIPVTSFSPSVMNVSSSAVSSNVPPNSISAGTNNVTSVSSSGDCVVLPKGDLNTLPSSGVKASLNNCTSNMSTVVVNTSASSGPGVGVSLPSTDAGNGMTVPHNTSMDMPPNNGMHMPSGNGMNIPPNPGMNIPSNSINMPANNGMTMPLGPGMNMPSGSGMGMCHPRMVCGTRMPNAGAGNIPSMMGCGGPESGCSSHGNLMATPPTMRAPGAIAGAGCTPGGAPLMHCVDGRASSTGLPMHYKGSNMSGVHVREPFMDSSGASCGQPSQHYCQQPLGYQSHMGHYGQLRPMQHQLMCPQQQVQHPDAFMCNSMMTSVRPQLNNSKVMHVNGGVQNHGYMHCRTNSPYNYNGYVAGGSRGNACITSKATNVGEIRPTSRESPRCDSACSSHSETGSFIRSTESRTPVSDNSSAGVNVPVSPGASQTVGARMPPSTNVLSSGLQPPQNRPASSKSLLSSESVSLLQVGSKSCGSIRNSEAEVNLNSPKNQKNDSFQSACASKDHSEVVHPVTDTKCSPTAVENPKPLGSNGNDVTQAAVNLDIDLSMCHKGGKSSGHVESVPQLSPMASHSYSSDEWPCSSKPAKCEPSVKIASHQTEQSVSTAVPPSDSQNSTFSPGKSNSSMGQCVENESSKLTYDGASVDSGVDSSVRSGSCDSVQIVGGALTPNHSMAESPTMCKVVCTSSQVNVVPSSKEWHGNSASAPSFANLSHNTRDQVCSTNNFYSVASANTVTAAFTGPGLSQTSFVIVPFGWRRIVSGNRVVYISPSGNELSSASAVSQYLTTEGTCKCGLQCPLKVASVFCFDPTVPDRPTLPAELTNRNVLQSCTHRRKLAAAFTKHVNSTRQQHLALQQQQQPARTCRDTVCHYNHPPSHMTMQSHAGYAGAMMPHAMHQVHSAPCEQPTTACGSAKFCGAKCSKEAPHVPATSCEEPPSSSCYYVSQANSGFCEHGKAETTVTASNSLSCASSTASNSCGDEAPVAGAAAAMRSSAQGPPATAGGAAVSTVSVTVCTAGAASASSTVYSTISSVSSTASNASTANFSPSTVGVMTSSASSAECSSSCTSLTTNSVSSVTNTAASSEHSALSNVCSPTLAANGIAASLSFNATTGNPKSSNGTSGASVITSSASNASVTTSGSTDALSENSGLSTVKLNTASDNSAATIERVASGSTTPSVKRVANITSSSPFVPIVSSTQFTLASTTRVVQSVHTYTSPSSKTASPPASTSVVQVSNSCISPSTACGSFYSNSNFTAISGTSMSIMMKSKTPVASSAVSAAHSFSGTDPSLMNVPYSKSNCISSSSVSHCSLDQLPSSTNSTRLFSTASSNVLSSNTSVQSFCPVSSSLNNSTSSEVKSNALSKTPATAVMASPLTCSGSMAREMVTLPSCSVSLVSSATVVSCSASATVSAPAPSLSLPSSQSSCESKPVEVPPSSANSERLASASPSSGHPQHHMQLGQQKQIMMMQASQDQHIIMPPQGIIPQQTYMPQHQMMLQNQHFEQRGYIPPQHQMQDACRPPFFRGSIMVPRNSMMRGPFMPPAGAYRMPLGPRMGCKPVWPVEDEKSAGVKRRRGGGGRTRKRAKAADESATGLAPPCSSTVPSFLEDPNAYLAQQTAMLNSTMAGGPGQFSPQGSAALARHSRPSELERPGPVVNLMASGALASPSTENSTTSVVTPPSSIPSLVSQSPISSSTAVSDPQESFHPTSVSDSKNVKRSSSSAHPVTSGNFPQQKLDVNMKLSPSNSVKNESQFSYASSDSEGIETACRLTKSSSPRLPSLPTRPRSSSPRISGRSYSTFAMNQSLQGSASLHKACGSSQKQHESPEGRPCLASPEPSTTSGVGSSTGRALGVQLQCDSASSRAYLKDEISDKKFVNCCELDSVSNFTCTAVDKKPLESSKFQKQSDWSVKISTARSGAPASNDQVSSSGKACSISPTASNVPKKSNTQDGVTNAVDSSQTEVEPNKRSWLSAGSSRLSQSRGTEMLAIRSHVLRASPTSNFDLEKEDTQDTDGGDDDYGSNDTSDLEDACSNSAEVLPASSVAACGSHSKPAYKDGGKTGGGSSAGKSMNVPSLMDTRVSCSVSAAGDTDVSNKPLSPGPISSTCSQTPLEMVQNIVSSIPLPPVSHPCASVSAFSSDCISCTLPSGSAASSRQTPPCLTQTGGTHQAALAAPLHHGLYEGVVRGGILVQQPTVAVSSSSVVVVGPKHASHVTSLSALQPVQPLVHLVNPFPTATPLIIQQTAGIGNISNLGNISAICSNAQLLPSSGAAFVASQHASTQSSSNVRTPLPLGSSSPQLQVAQVVTTDGYMDGTSSPSGSSTVSTPHATPPDPAPSPQPARKRRRRRNSSTSQAPANILPTLIVGSRPQQPQQQQLVMAGAQHRFTSQASGVGAHQVITSGSGGNMIAASAATAINVVQMVGPSMGGTLTAGALQPPAILVGSNGTPGVILPSDATFLSTDPNTCLTYPVQIVGVTATPAQQVVAVRPPPPPSDGNKVVTCLSSPPTASNSGVHLYAHNANQAVVNARSLGAPAAVLASDYLTYQQHVFMQQPIVAKTSIAGISPHQGTVVSAGQQLQLSSSSSSSSGDGGHSVSISTQTLQSEGENCDVSSTGDVQQSRVSSASSVSPNSPSHQSAEVTTTRLDEEPQCLSTPHKPPSADSVSNADTPPPQASGWW